MSDIPGQMLMPWAEIEGVEAADVEALTGGVPLHAEAVTPARAAQALGCTERTVRNMIEEGTLLARKVGASADTDRTHWRVVVRADRPLDPARRKMLTLAEAAVIFSNLTGG